MVAAAETMDPPQVREAAQPEAPGDLRAAARGNAAALVRVSALLSGDTKIDGLDRLYTVDSAHLVLRLKPKRARALLRQLDEAPSLSLLRALDAEVGAQLLDPETTARVAEIVSRLDLGTAADFLDEAPRLLVRAVLDLDPRSEAFRDALRYRADVAGA